MISLNVYDLILTSDSERVLEIEYCPRLESVRIGHAVICLTFGIYLKDKNEAKLNKRDASKADCKGISEEMGKDDWKNSQRGLEINEAYNQFFSFYEQIWNEYVPFKRNSNKRKGR